MGNGSFPNFIHGHRIRQHEQKTQKSRNLVYWLYISDGNKLNPHFFGCNFQIYENIFTNELEQAHIWIISSFSHATLGIEAIIQQL